MEYKELILRGVFVVSGAFLFYKGYKFPRSEIQNLALTSWAPQILELVGLGLISVAWFLPRGTTE